MVHMMIHFSGLNLEADFDSFDSEIRAAEIQQRLHHAENIQEIG